MDKLVPQCPMGQAAMLSQKDIETIGNFIQAGLPGE